MVAGLVQIAVLLQALDYVRELMVVMSLCVLVAVVVTMELPSWVRLTVPEMVLAMVTPSLRLSARMPQDRKSVVQGKRVDVGGRCLIKKKKERRMVWQPFEHLVAVSSPPPRWLGIMIPLAAR